MLTPPKDRLELVLMADQPAPIRLWTQSTAELSKRYEFDKQKSVRILGGGACVLLMMLAFFPAPTVMLALLATIILFPMKLVGMAGFSRGTSG